MGRAVGFAPAHIFGESEMTMLARYNAAEAALAAAVLADEVMKVRLDARGIEALGRVAGNLDFEIKGAALRIQAEAGRSRAPTQFHRKAGHR